MPVNEYCSPANDMRVVGMSALKSVVLVVLQQLSLEECKQTGPDVDVIALFQ
jgi:hypothetical protein